MMIACCWLLLAAFTQLPETERPQAASPQVDVTTLVGETQSGQLVSLSVAELQLTRDGQTIRIPTSELLQVQPVGGAATSPKTAAATTPIIVNLWDGSRLQFTSLGSQGDRFVAEHDSLGKVELPRAAVQSVQLGAADPAVDVSWSELRQRDKKRDYLVIRKGDVLDHLDGVVGELSADKLKFLLDGDQVEVNRSRVYGWIYATDSARKSATGIRVELPGQQVVYASAVTWSPEGWQVRLSGASQPQLIPADGLRSLDFSAGKVMYLSAVEPRLVEHVPFFDAALDWPYQRDRNLLGRPLRVGSRTFARGLAVHSRTTLTYRLGGEYRRLSATVGIDPDLPYRENPAVNNARLTIRGDRNVLYEADIRAGDNPVILDIPVAEVRELELLVDFGEGNLDIGDRVHFGDIKVLK